jgi:hypothetical protein
MNELPKKLTEEYYKGDSSTEYDNLMSIFENVFDIFINDHYDKEFNSLFCNIHNSFEKGHNCVGCNLNESNLRIENFLIQHRNFRDLHLTFTNFILLLYLQVESIYEYFEIIQLQESYRGKHFKIFQDVKRWANFLKHPKSFMLVHHPSWTYEGRTIKSDNSGKYLDEKIKRTTPTIDSAFVNEFYAGGKKNRELFKQLNKKENLIVVFPNPIILIKEFTKAQKKFTEIISNNEIVRDLLENKATIENHFLEDDEE